MNSINSHANFNKYVEALIIVKSKIKKAQLERLQMA